MTKRTVAFTLLETTIIIAIIVGLMMLVIPNVTQLLMRTRDAQRLGDMETLRLAFECFFEDNGRYPDHSDCIQDAESPTTWGCIGGPENDVINVEAGAGECIGDHGQPYGLCTGTDILERLMRPYIRGKFPQDPLYGKPSGEVDGSGNPINYYYAYDMAHWVDWIPDPVTCIDDNPANNEDQPLFGFRRAELQTTRNLENKVTCTKKAIGDDMDLDVADFNAALTNR